MKTKEILGSISPVYGMATGEGLFGKSMGVIPQILNINKDKEEEKKKSLGIPALANAPNMKSGGKVKKMRIGGYVRAADGCVQRGKTKGRIV